MSRLRHATTALVLAVVVAATMLPVGQSSASDPHAAHAAPVAQVAPGPYLLDFNSPVVGPAILPYPGNGDLSVLVQSRDRFTWDTLETMTADHGANCSSPPATHQHSGNYGDSVFPCGAGDNQHLMTALKASGYGVIYLMPAALADFSEGETVISFDVSTLRTSQRDWWDIWVTPFEDAVAAPLHPTWPDLAGQPNRAIHIDMSSFGGETIHRGSIIANFADTDLDSCWWCGTESALSTAPAPDAGGPSAARRDRYELRISKTHIKFWLPKYGVVWVDKELAAPLDWTSGVVQIGHHSYTPEKDCSVPAGEIGCRANTWHWDNIAISRSTPLTMIPARERRATPAQPVYSFAQPAPAGAYLQVHALAMDLDYSLDNGATWAPMGKQPSNTHKWGGRRTYRQSIPAGTTSVMLRGTEETGDWDANHAVLLSQQQKPASPTPTIMPATNTPIPTTPPPPTGTAVLPTTVPATATVAPLGNCSMTVSADQKTGSWRCP